MFIWICARQQGAHTAMNTPRDNKTKYRPHAVSITFLPLMLDKVKAGAAMMGTPLDTFIQCAAYRAAEKAADSPAGRKWIDKTKGEMARALRAVKSAEAFYHTRPEVEAMPAHAVPMASVKAISAVLTADELKACEMAANDCNASLEAWTRYALLHTARLALEDKESREIMETARALREHRQDGGKVNA